MKYEKMLCWVRPHEKKELKEAVAGRFPLVFAKNYEDFKAQITADAYLVFSIVKAVRGLKKLQKLIRSFPELSFHLYYRSNDDGFMTDKEMTLLTLLLSVLSTGLFLSTFICFSSFGSE